MEMCGLKQSIKLVGRVRGKTTHTHTEKKKKKKKKGGGGKRKEAGERERGSQHIHMQT